MRKIAKLLVFGAVLGSAPACQTHYSHVASVSILPLKSLRMYETGVGYFERSGAIGANNSGLPVPAGHLDDALKTLVLLSPDGAARVYGIAFPTSVSKGMGRALAGLPQNDDDEVSYRDLLQSLKGATLEVRTAQGPLTGRLIDVLGSGDGSVPTAAPIATKKDKGDKKDKDKDQDKEAETPPPANELTLLLLSTQGELLRLSTAQVQSVRPLDPHFASRLRTALDAMSQRGAQSQRLLRLLSRDGGPVTLGYIAETPLWRVTYRLVLNEPQRSAALQGWALIHNDTDEDWRGVKVHMVSGRPDSFLFPIAAPRYSRRQLVTPENELSTVPQLLGTTADRLWGDHIGDSFGVGGLGLTGTGMGGGGTGEGTIGLGSIGTIGHGGGSGDGQSSLLQVGNLAAAAQATGVETGALFTYSLKEPLDLRAHDSALIPFVSEGIEAEVITILDSPRATARIGVRLVNSTHQTLPSGPLAVFGDGGLAGESSLDRMKPGERRFIQYGHDLDLELSTVRSQSKDEPQRVSFERDRLEEHFLRRDDVLYRIANRSGLPRTLYLGLGVGANGRVQGADRIDFDPEKKHAVAIFELPPGSRVERPLSTVEGLQHTTALKSLRAARLVELAAAAAIPAAERAILQEAAARQKDLEEAGKESEKTVAEIKKTEKELERLREHLKAMGHETAAGAAQNPVLKRMLDAEDRLTGLQKKQDTLDAAQEQRHDVVRKVLEKLPKHKA